jgi:hypothetical protein
MNDILADRRAIFDFLFIVHDQRSSAQALKAESLTMKLHLKNEVVSMFNT